MDDGWRRGGVSGRAPRALPASTATAATGATRTADDLEAWAKAGIDREIDAVETDPAGTRNDRLNKRGLRGFRLAMCGGFDLDDVYDALIDACHTNRLVEDDGIASVRRTLRSALNGAHQHGPADPPDELPANVTFVSPAMFRTTRTR